MKQYHNLAKYYDLLVKDDEATNLWVSLFEQYKNENSVLELAAGTGEISIALFNKGYNIIATDISIEMLQALKQKNTNITTSCLDMRSFKLDHRVNNVICFCDSVNYLSSLEELESMFKSVYDNLTDDGVFMFDAHDERRISEFAEPFIEEGIIDGVPYQWTIISNNNQIHQHFVFYEEHPLEEYHIQTVFEHLEILKLLNKIGFEVNWIQDFGADDLEERKCYIARKKLLR